MNIKKELHLVKDGANYKVYIGEQYLGVIYMEVDAFYVFLPDENLQGAYDEYLVKFLSTQITKLNAPWKKFIDEHLK